MSGVRMLSIIAVTAVLAASCATLGDDDNAPVAVEVLAGPNSVLSAVVQIDAVDPVQPVVRAVSDEGHEIRVEATETARHHALALVGLRAEQHYTIRVEGNDALAALGDLAFSSGALPPGLPVVEVDADPSATPGFTLFNASAGDKDVEYPGALIAVDETGEVVWYHRARRSMADVRQLANGNLLLNWDSTGAREIDTLGNLVREWTTTSRVDAGRIDDDGLAFYSDGAFVLDAVRLHHEVAFELASGNFLALAMEVRDIEGFPDGLCDDDDALPDGPRAQRGDIVIEYTPDGDIVREFPLLDAVDPVAVPGVAQCETRRDPFVNDNEPYVDWTHGNSAQLFEDRNIVLVSARHLNQILALRYKDDADGPAGSLIWSLGAGGDFDLTEGEWFVEQHAPEWQDDGTILVYDNGTDRAGTVPGGGTEPPYSRAVVYEIDPPVAPGERGTARQVWEHRSAAADGTPDYASFLGDADAVGDNNVLITHGAIAAPEIDDFRSRIIEVDRATGDIVLDINVLAGNVGWRSYRAEHLARLSG